MEIMGCRLQNLYAVIEGFAKTKVPLILYDGTNLLPFLSIDDIGIYVFIPQLVRMLGVFIAAGNFSVFLWIDYSGIWDCFYWNLSVISFIGGSLLVICCFTIFIFFYYALYSK